MTPTFNYEKYKNKTILLVDDIIDSGKTIVGLYEQFLDVNCTVQVASLYTNKDCFKENVFLEEEIVVTSGKIYSKNEILKKNSTFKDIWINFPWEKK